MLPVGSQMGKSLIGGVFVSKLEKIFVYIAVFFICSPLFTLIVLRDADILFGFSTVGVLFTIYNLFSLVSSLFCLICRRRRVQE